MLDKTKPVDVYYNVRLNKFSVRQNGKVVAHMDYLTLKNCKLVVGKKGQLRVLRTGHKNVHAVVRGFLMDGSVDGNVLCNVPVKYNPLFNNSFVRVNSSTEIFEAKFAFLWNSSKFKLKVME